MGDQQKELYHLELHGFGNLEHGAQAPVKFTLERKIEAPRVIMGGPLNE